MAQTYLVCEGEGNSLDQKLLNHVLAQFHGLLVRIEPAGGGNHPRIVRAWLEKRVPGDVALLIHDRDYQPLRSAESGWLDPNEKCLTWTAHEIENYLLEPWILRTLFDDYRQTATGTWVSALPSDLPASEAVLAGLAPQLFNDHIARTLCGQLRQHKSTLGKSEINGPGGIDPYAGSAADWQAAILAEIAQLQATCGAIAAAPQFQSPAILADWASIELQVRDPAFLNSGAYRRDVKREAPAQPALAAPPLELRLSRG